MFLPVFTTGSEKPKLIRLRALALHLNLWAQIRWDPPHASAENIILFSKLHKIF